MPNPSSKSAYRDRLVQALTNAVGEERIGVPRFVRWLDRLDTDTAVNDSLTSALESCKQIFDGDPIRQHRSGDNKLHGTIHATWANGASAIISAGPNGRNASMNSGPEIMLLGSSGSIFFDGTNGGIPTGEQVGRV
jgi:hypothetical protein